MRILALTAAAIAICAAADEKIQLPSTPEDIATGKKLFLGGCTYCHGPTGDGGKGADLSRPVLVRAKSDDDLVRIIEVGIPGTEMPGAWHMTRREITQTAAFVKTLSKVEVKAVPGDPAKGKAQYAKLGCSGCHTVKNGVRYEGGFTGPDLSSIGARRSAKHLMEALTAPGESVAENYQMVRVVTRDGQSIFGRRLNEDTFSLVVRDSQGSNHIIPKSGLRDVVTEPKKSLMPAYRLQQSELEDLVAYMVTLKEAE
ncbi:MAG: c-type cytochrome [Bryobacteraceae bacterium]